MTGIYVHIPFCRSKCFYCDFPSYAGKENEYAAYRDALLREIQQSAELPETDGVDTIYMGGGSPTVFSSTDLADILEAIRDRTGRSDRVGRCAEITVEANPGTIQEETLQILKASGVNRLSMGLQAWQNHLLKTLGRIHSRALFLENYRKAMDAGFENISLDLMFALPGQTLADWTETLENAAALGPRHISAYSLIVEEKTPFHR
ncbi:MAG: radical SAM protein, partial [Clostridiales bacterium]|nr:radical SAM protein [Clostridiales bacterium]